MSEVKSIPLLVSVCGNCYKPIYKYPEGSHDDAGPIPNVWFHFDTYMKCEGGKSEVDANPSSAFTARVMEITKKMWEELAGGKEAINSLWGSNVPLLPGDRDSSQNGEGPN